MKVEHAYTLGCLSIHLQEAKDLETRNLGLKLMAASNKTPSQISNAFGAGRLDTAVSVSARRSKLLKK